MGMQARAKKMRIRSFVMSRNLEMIGWGAAGLLMARVQMFGAYAPLGVAGVGASLLSGGNALSLLIGAIVGRLTIGVADGRALQDIAAMALVYLGWALIQKTKIKQTPWLMVGICVVASAGAQAARGSNVLYDWLMWVASAGVTAVMVPVFAVALERIREAGSRRLLTGEEWTCMALLAAAVVMGGMGFAIGPFRPAQILAFLLVMGTGYIAGSGAGGATGIVIGLAMALVRGDNIQPFIMGNLGLCGMICGALRRLGRPGVALGFILANAIATLVVNGSVTVILPLVDSLTAGVIFMLVPKKVFGKIMELSKATTPETDAYLERVRGYAVEQLDQNALMLAHMADAFLGLPDSGNPAEGEVTALMQQVARRTCNDCALRAACWKRDYNKTYAMFYDLMVRNKAERLKKSDLPEMTARRCMRLDALLRAMTQALQGYQERKSWQSRVDDSRRVLGEQLEGVSQRLAELTEELQVPITYDAATEQAILEEMDRCGIEVKQVSACQIDERWEVNIAFAACGGKGSCIGKVARGLSNVLQSPMRCATQGCNGHEHGICRKRFIEAEGMAVQTGAASLPQSGQEVCGDSYAFQQLADGNYLMTLSDGMGSGERAAQESSAAVTLVKEMQRAGMSQELILRTVNRLLLMRSGGDRFATVDWCTIDLAAGEAEMIKVSAAPTFILRGDTVEKISCGALPLGMLEEVQPGYIRKKLEPGDMVIMMSDGVVDGIGEENMKRLLAALLYNLEGTPKQMAEMVIHEVLRQSGGQAADDMTVLIGRVYEPMAS